MISSPAFSEEVVYVQVFEQARVCYGNLGLEISSYQSRLTEMVKKYLKEPHTKLAIVNFLGRIHTDDLYLTTACAQGCEVAWQRFDQFYRSQVYRLARSFCANADIGGDLAGNLMADLFFADQSNRPRIASYEGLSSLGEWLRIVVAHRAENERKRKSNQGEDLSYARDIIEEFYLEKLEARIRANCYTPLIRDALKQAGQGLNQREQLILLMKYDEAMSSKQIAAMLGVQPPRITQMLQRIRQKIKQEVIRLLSQKYHLNVAAIEECLIDLAENPEHSLLEPLKAS